MDEHVADGDVVRCPWCRASELYIAYHDDEWGVPSTDERHLFEMLILEGQQAGLSWLTILNKRDGYRRAFAGFDPEAMARFTDADVARLAGDPGIVRNRPKIEAAIGNARAYIELRSAVGSFSDWAWDFVDGRPVVNRPRFMEDVPSETRTSRRLARELRRHGFRYVGPTICYAWMQSVGLVDDHLADCWVARAADARGTS